MVSGRRPFYTPVRAFNFVRAFVGLSIPTARRFSLNVEWYLVHVLYTLLYTRTINTSTRGTGKQEVYTRLQE